MALYTRVEYAGLCGVSSGDLSNYVKRQKVYVSKDDEGGEMIDDQLPANAEFLRKRKALMAEKGQNGATVREAVETAGEPDKKGGNGAKVAKNVTESGKSGTKRQKSDTEEQGRRKSAGSVKGSNSAKEQGGGGKAPVFVAPSAEDLFRWSVKTRNEWLDSEKLRLEIEEKQMKMDKLAGNLVPLDVITGVMSGYSKGITDKFLLLVEHLLTDVSQRYNMSSKDLGDYRKDVKEKINKAVDECVNEGKNSVEVVVNEFSDARGRGEKKNI